MSCNPDLDPGDVGHRYLPCRDPCRAKVLVSCGNSWWRPGLDPALVDVKSPPLDRVRAEGLPLGIGVDAILRQLVYCAGREDAGLKTQLAHQVWEHNRVHHDRGQGGVVVPGKLVK